MRPPPEGAAKVDAGGRSPGSRVNASLRPSRSEKLQWQVEGRSPLTVAGAAAESGETLTAFPFLVPPHAGTVDGRTIAASARFASAHGSHYRGVVAGRLGLAAVAFLLLGTALVVEFARRRAPGRRNFFIVLSRPLRTISAPMPSVASLASAIGRHRVSPELTAKCYTILERFYFLYNLYGYAFLAVPAR
jgi:hypothetical protein